MFPAAACNLSPIAETVPPNRNFARLTYRRGNMTNPFFASPHLTTSKLIPCSSACFPAASPVYPDWQTTISNDWFVACCTFSVNLPTCAWSCSSAGVTIGANNFPMYRLPDESYFLSCVLLHHIQLIWGGQVILDKNCLLFPPFSISIPSRIR